MARFYAGLDLGSSVCVLSVIDERDVKVYGKEFPTSAHDLRQAVDEGKRRVGGEWWMACEEGELAHWASEVLRAEVSRFVVSDPKHNAWVARDPNKNDTVDSEKLGRQMKAGFLREVYHTTDAERSDFKRAVQHYHDLTRTQASMKCQIKARYRAYGVIEKTGTVFEKEERSETLSKIPSESGRQRVKQMYDLLDSMTKAREQAREVMVAMGRAYPEVALLQTVPGVGPVWACTFSAYVQTPWRFSHKQKLWRYCRLGITNRLSNGELLGRQRLDSSGIGELKNLSFQAFMAAQRGDNTFHRHYSESLKRTGDRTHARLSTQRKILTVLWTMWKRNEAYRDSRGSTGQDKNVKRAEVR